MSFLGGASGGSAPKPPPFVAAPIYGPNGAVSLASQFGNLGYNLADQAFASQWPGLVSLRNSEIGSVGGQLANPKLDPAAQNQITNSAESQTLEAFGGGVGDIGTAGSAVRGATAAGVANSTQAIEDYNRQSNLNLVNANPQRLTDLTGAQLVQIMLGNILGANQNRYGTYAAGVQNNTAQNASNQQSTLAAIQAAISIAAAAASDVLFKENINDAGKSPTGLRIVEFNYIWNKKRLRGVLANDVPNKAVKVLGRLFVDYASIGIQLTEAA